MDRPAVYSAGWICGDPTDYDREYCIDLVQLRVFLHETQPEVAGSLRHGIKHGAHHIDVFYGTPSPGNPVAKERYDANRFSVTRQLRYSRNETQLSLDLAIFINGLPIATFELKTALPSRRSKMPSSSTGVTAIGVKNSLSSGAVWCISRWTNTRYASARILKARNHGFCP